MRRVSGLVMLALSVGVLTACGDDDGSGASTSDAVATTIAAATTSAIAAPVTSAAPTSEAVPVPDGVDPAVVRELQAAIDAYDSSYALATAAPGDPSHVEFLAATTDGDLRQGVQAAIADRRERGEALRSGPSGTVLDQRIEAVETITTDEATVLTCLFNGSERYVVATGEVLDGSQVAWQNRVTLRRGDDGGWRVDAGERIDESREVEANPCA